MGNKNLKILLLIIFLVTQVCNAQKIGLSVHGEEISESETFYKNIHKSLEDTNLIVGIITNTNRHSYTFVIEVEKKTRFVANRYQIRIFTHSNVLKYGYSNYFKVYSTFAEDDLSKKAAVIFLIKNIAPAISEIKQKLEEEITLWTSEIEFKRQKRQALEHSRSQIEPFFNTNSKAIEITINKKNEQSLTNISNRNFMLKKKVEILFFNLKDNLEILLSVVFICIILFFITRYLYYRDIVIYYSLLYKKVILLNNSTVFEKSIKPQYCFYKRCDSKKQYDSLRLRDFFFLTIEEEFEKINSIIKILYKNKIAYEEYLKSYGELKRHSLEPRDVTYKYVIKNIEYGFSFEKTKLLLKKHDLSSGIISRCKIPTKIYLNIENPLFQEALILKPIVETKVYCQVEYNSPKGRKWYGKHDNFSFGDLIIAFQQEDNNRKSRNSWKSQVRRERLKMTASLRFDILKRDNYTCCICGASKQDGVKLHVDHIFPVSKGGKTEISNLQTLCDRCNSGKSNKT